MPEAAQLDVSTLRTALGRTPTDGTVKELLAHFGASQIDPHITSFPEGSFHNYYAAGVSLYYAGPSTSRTSSGQTELQLDRIDLYNPAREEEQTVGRRRRKPTAYSPSPDLIFNFSSMTVPIPAPPPPDPNIPQPKPKATASATRPTSIERPKTLIVDRTTTAKSLVECFGEPSKKGGTIGWLDTYMEWEIEVLDTEDSTIRLGILVELREGGGEGMDVWDRASGWEWACLKVFAPAR